MAIPNIAAMTSLYFKTALGLLTTSEADLLDNAAGSHKAKRVVGVYVSNVDGSVSVDVTIAIKRSATNYRIANTIPVPADATLMPVMKGMAPFVLEEGDKLVGQASANSDAEYIVSYEEYDDA